MLKICFLVVVFVASASAIPALAETTAATSRVLTWHQLGSYEYYIEEDSMRFAASYSEAEMRCANERATLAVVKTQEINDFLVNTIGRVAEFPYAFFIGLKRLSNDRYDFQWVDGTHLSSGYSNWYTDRPTGHINIGRNCTTMGHYSVFADGLGWNDIQCTPPNPLRFICQRPIQNSPEATTPQTTLQVTTAAITTEETPTPEPTSGGCPETWVNATCGTGGCLPTCSQRLIACPTVCVAGCTCPTNTVLHENRCIYEEECPDETTTSPPSPEPTATTRQYTTPVGTSTSRPAGSCPPGVAIYQCLGSPCSVNTCQVPGSVCTNNYCGGCFANFTDYFGNPLSENQCNGNGTCPATMTRVDCGSSCIPTCEERRPFFCTLECYRGCTCPENTFYRRGRCVPEYECPNVTCPDTMVYSECGTCIPTCDQVNQIIPCTRECRIGCTCPQGTYIHNNRCVTADECPPPGIPRLRCPEPANACSRRSAWLCDYIQWRVTFMNDWQRTFLQWRDHVPGEIPREGCRHLYVSCKNPGQHGSALDPYGCGIPYCKDGYYNDMQVMDDWVADSRLWRRYFEAWKRALAQTPAQGCN